jgi:hypothetical protein
VNNSPYLIIRLLLIQGPTNDYRFEFAEGVNLIWGDMDCGKSSILNLIDYCLGGKNERLLFAEMKRHGRTACLEVDLNGTICTLERDIHSPSSAIRVYLQEFSNIRKTFPKLMSAFSQDETAPDGWISNFLLATLGIPQVSIKESRLRENSNSDRLSFRDLMKLMYLKQTKIGSESLLDNGNGVVFNKNVEVQKFVYNVYDEQLTQLHRDLGIASSDLNEMRKHEQSIRHFLKDVEIDLQSLDKLEDRDDDLLNSVNDLEIEIENLKTDFQATSEISSAISNAVKEITHRIGEISNEAKKIDTEYDSYSRLRNTYLFDLETLQTSSVAREYLGEHGSEHKVPCPVCAQSVSVTDDSLIDSEKLALLSKSVSNRFSGVEEILSQFREKQASLITEEKKLHEQLKEARRSFDENNITALSPLVSSIQALESAKTTANNQLHDARKNSRIANKYNEVGSQIENQVKLIERIKLSINIVQDGLIGIENVIEKLNGFLVDYLKKSGLQNLFGVDVDKRFIPWFREISYFNTSSGGVRTIVSIGSYFIRLKYSLFNNTNLPSFLMIDTPGQNIGRYRAMDDTSDVSDPKLYENIFSQLLSLSKLAKSHNQHCQIIVVDNDFPESFADEPDLMVVKQFNKRGSSDKGLFWDA